MSQFNDEQIKQLFEQFDTNHDGRINREEFLEAAKIGNLKLEPSTIDFFIDAIDTNKDGEVSLEEFAYFVKFKASAFKDFNELLQLTGRSIGALRHLVSTKAEHTADENSSLNFSVRDKSIESPETLPTVLQLLGGDLAHHAELRRLIGPELNHQYALIFTFKVTDRKRVLENLPQYCEALKAVLLELGPETKALAESIEFDFRETVDGVLLVLDLAKNPVVQAYVGAAKNELAQLQNFPVELTLRLATDFDLANYHLETEQMLSHRYAFDALLKTFNLSTLMNIAQIKQTILTDVESKSFSEASFLIAMLSMKNLALEFDFDDKLRTKLKSELGVQNKETLLLDLVTSARQGLEESGIKDFIDSMDFIKLALKDLKEAGLSEFGIFVSVGHLLLGLNAKGSVYNAFDNILQLE